MMQDGSSIFLATKRTRFHFDYVSADDYYIAENMPRKLNAIELYQVGDLHADREYEIESHVQFCHEISYIASGEGWYSINGRRFPVTKGDIVLTRKGTVHDGASDDRNPLRNFYLGFCISSAYAAQPPYTDILAVFERQDEIIAHDHPEIATFFSGVFSELLNRNANCWHMIEYYLVQMLITVSRIFAGSSSAIYHPEGTPDPNGMLVHSLVQYIDNHVEDIDRLSDLANQFDYSYSHLAHVFKDRLGFSIYQYYDRKRFDRAVELLQQGQWSITEISERLRYQSLHAFSKAFAKRFGRSPSDYMSLYRSQTLPPRTALPGMPMLDLPPITQQED